MSEMVQGLLDPNRIKVFKDSKGRPMIRVGEEEKMVYRFVRAFPLTSPDEFISVSDEDGKEIGIIRRLRDLDASSRAIVQEELEKAYFMPKIKRILKVKELYGGMTDFSVETDRGYREFECHGRSAVRWVGASRVVITDVDGNKYEIPDLKELDPRSRSLFGWVV